MFRTIGNKHLHPSSGKQIRIFNVNNKWPTFFFNSYRIYLLQLSPITRMIGVKVNSWFSSGFSLTAMYIFKSLDLSIARPLCKNWSLVIVISFFFSIIQFLWKRKQKTISTWKIPRVHTTTTYYPFFVSADFFYFHQYIVH